MPCVYRPIVKRKGRKLRARFYWAKYVDANGHETRHVVRNRNGERVTDKAVASELLKGLVKRETHLAAGLVDVELEHAVLPIRKVIADYIRHLRRLNRSQNKPGRRYIRQSLAFLRRIIQRAEMTRLCDLTADKINRVMADLVHEGRSTGTANYYRTIASQLGKWAVVNKLLATNPIRDAQTLTGKATRKRRALWPEQAVRLIASAESRKLFYTVQLLSGLRVNEVRQLQWRDVWFDFKSKDGQAVPLLQLREEATKARRADRVPLHWRLAKELMAIRPKDSKPTDHIFKTTPTRGTFIKDCRRAGIPTVADDRGRTVDRHALRKTFVSWLGRLGVDLRIAQYLARHKPKTLTDGTYQDSDMLDAEAHKAVNRLPDVYADAQSENVVLRMTGTDGAQSPPDSVVPCVVPGVVPGTVCEGFQSSSSVANTAISGNKHNSENLANSQGNDGFCRGPSSSVANTANSADMRHIPLTAHTPEATPCRRVRKI